MLEVGPIDSELIVRVNLALDAIELTLERVVACPWIRSATLQHVHTVVDGGAVERAQHIDLPWWRIRVGVGGEDDVPLVVDVVQFRSPQVGRVWLILLIHVRERYAFKRIEGLPEAEKQPSSPHSTNP